MHCRGPCLPYLKHLAQLFEDSRRLYDYVIIDTPPVGLITDALVTINSIENQGDDIFDMSIEKLFAEEPDAKEVIKKREIYQVMEIVTDKCEDAANVIESIIVKYA